MGTIITLTTDFGLSDEYVGVMKGVILSRAPDARIVDLTHAVPPQDIRLAAYIIAAAHKYFPANTLHVIVVDPGVGSNRRIILLQAKGRLFLAPDNGVLTLLLSEKNFQAAFEVTCNHLFLSPVSDTFHGRDIFAPVAAHLAAGLPPEKVGPSLARKELTTLPLPKVHIDSTNNTVSGNVIGIDHFGNLITNIHQEDYRKLPPALLDKKISVVIGNTTIPGIHTSYAIAPPGTLLALFGSRGYLEIACNLGNAAQHLNAAQDDTVTLTFTS